VSVKDIFFVVVVCFGFEISNGTAAVKIFLYSTARNSSSNEIKLMN